MTIRPNILTIAGFDPSSGAGLSADLKTMERLRCYGYALCTGITTQNATDFKACDWVPESTLIDQLKLLLEEASFDFVKVGIIQSWKVLNNLLDVLFEKNPNCKVILDPVLSASAGFEFHNSQEAEWDKLIGRVYILTPNYEEIQQLMGVDFELGLKQVRKHTIVYLKGGHRPEQKGRDEVYLKDSMFALNPKTQKLSPKHGSGCVLSSALTCYLAQGFNMHKASIKAKRYTEIYLASTPRLLGYH